ncbi:MAG: hypothetical protein QM751_08865 [Paludibacteraceae bacterium]
MKKIILLLFFFQIVEIVYSEEHNFLFNQAASYSYGVSRDFVPVSPQSGSLGTYGITSVSHYTGTPDISIPLYVIESKDITLPISLNYHPANVKPDNLPGLYGLGWSLQFGGVISRVINGDPDIGQRPSDTGGQSLIVDDYRQVDEIWKDTAILWSFMNSRTQLAFRYEVDPDVYYFNFNGYSGQFYTSHDDTIKIQSKQGEVFSILFHKKLEQGELGSFSQISGFTIIDSKGIKYLFSEVEQTQTLLNSFSSFSSCNLYDTLTPTSWYLTQITSPNGAEIRIHYSNNNAILIRNRFIDFCFNNRSSQIPRTSRYRDNEKGYISYQVIPSSIISQNDSIAFNFSDALEQLPYPNMESTDLANQDNYYYLYDRSYVANNFRTPKKVDGFRVYDRQNQEVIKTKFIYSNDKSTRLKLYGVDICRTITSPYGEDYVQKEYRFSYNQKSLPPYLSGQTDYYGYYNGRGLFSSAMYYLNYSDYINLLSLIDYAKSSDIAYTQAELLTKITYPTRGYTLFEYEQHNYGKQQKTWPFEVITNSNGDQITGGVRIKSIRSYNSDNTLLTERKYHYKTNYINGGSTSSGVVAYKPLYVDFFQNKYILYNGKPISSSPRSFFSIASNPVYSLANEEHIAYSEVTVEESGNGFTVYKYKNYDNGYNDKEPSAFITNIISSDLNGKIGLHEHGKTIKG